MPGFATLLTTCHTQNDLLLPPMRYDDFFSEFPPVSKEDWLRQVAKDLKGKPLDELTWQATDDLRVSPFAHADDFQVPPQPLATEPNRWEICELLPVIDPVVANRQALDALEGGAWGLELYFDTPPSFDTLARLFEGIYLDFIGLHFTGPGVAHNLGALLGHLDRLARQRDIPTETLRGSFGYDPAHYAASTARNIIPDWRYLADLVEFAQQQFPQFRMLTIGGSDDTETATDLLRRANIYLEKLTERGIPAAHAAATVQFSVKIGPSYFLEMAQLRAINLVWINMLKAWGMAPTAPALAVSFRPDAYTDDLYTNMIRATTMSMSAVLGGAGRLTVLPYDAGREALATYPQAFSRRIARNVQHLLKMESGFDQLTDPAAGSYYIETLTRQLADKMWQELGGLQTPNLGTVLG